jgi:ferredoxin
MSTTIPMNAIPVTGGGYTCSTCGLFVSWGSYHVCYPASPTFQWVVPLTRYYTCQKCGYTGAYTYSYLNDKPICSTCLSEILKGQPAPREAPENERTP